MLHDDRGCTQVLDLASKVADLAGLTARVSQLLEALTASHGTTQQPPSNTNTQSRSSRAMDRSSARTDSGFGHTAGSKQHRGRFAPQQQQQLQKVAVGTSPSHLRYASQGVLLLSPQLMLVPGASGSDGSFGAAKEPGHTTDRGDSTATATTTAAQREAAAAQQEAAGSQLVRAGSNTGHFVQDEHQHTQQQQQYCSSSHQGGKLGAQVMPTRDTGADADDDSPCHSPMSHDEVMQVSIHSMGTDLLLQEVRKALPDAPRLAPLLAVLTFQFCGSARVQMLQACTQQQQQQMHSSSSSRSRKRNGSPGPPGSVTSCVSKNLHECKGLRGMLNPAGGGGAGGADAGGLLAGESGPGDSCGELCGAADMERMLAVLIHWQQKMHAHITSR